MEPTAPDLQLVPEVTKAVSVSAPDPGPCRTAVIAVVGISMAIVTLGVLSGKWQEEGLGPRMQKDIPSVKGLTFQPDPAVARTGSGVQEYAGYAGSVCNDKKERVAGSPVVEWGGNRYVSFDSLRQQEGQAGLQGCGLGEAGLMPVSMVIQ